MHSLPLVLLFVALTFVSWGAYGPVLHHGTQAMGNDSLRAFFGVGLAYFFIAVVAPIIILRRQNEKGKWTFVGTAYSIVAGAVGAIGALGVILALAYKGKPVYVMPLVFGFAPIVNTLVTAYMGHAFSQIKPIFIAGVITAALGAGGVLYFKPTATPHAVEKPAQPTLEPTESPPVEPEQSSEANKAEEPKPSAPETKPDEPLAAAALPPSQATPSATSPAEAPQPSIPESANPVPKSKIETPKTESKSPVTPSALSSASRTTVPPPTSSPQPDPLAPSPAPASPPPKAAAPAAATPSAAASDTTKPAVEKPEAPPPVVNPAPLVQTSSPNATPPAASTSPVVPAAAPSQPPTTQSPTRTEPALPPPVVNPVPLNQDAGGEPAKTTGHHSSPKKRTVKFVFAPANQEGSSSSVGAVSQGSADSTSGSPLKIVLSIIMAAFCWGAYGPMLHQGQARMGGSRLRPFICVGIAYFIIAVAAPLYLIYNSTSTGSWSFVGLGWSIAAGAAGAIGALGIILAFNAGGKPFYVMPLVFGFAPVINTFITLTESGLWGQVKPMFWVSLAVVITGAITVLTNAPKPQHAPSKS